MKKDPIWQRDYESLKALYEYHIKNPGTISQEYLEELARELNQKEIEKKLKNK